MIDKLKLPATPGKAEAPAKSEHEAPAAVPPASAAISDDPLIALGRQWEDAYRNWQAAVPAGHSDEETKAYEDRRDALGKIAWGLEDQAAEIPAQPSLEGH